MQVGWVASAKHAEDRRFSGDSNSSKAHVDCVTFKAVLLVLEHGGNSKEYGVVRKTICTRDLNRSRFNNDGESNNNDKSTIGSINSDKNWISSDKILTTTPCCACGEAKYEVLCLFVNICL